MFGNNHILLGRFFFFIAGLSDTDGPLGENLQDYDGECEFRKLISSLPTPDPTRWGYHAKWMKAAYNGMEQLLERCLIAEANLKSTDVDKKIRTFIFNIRHQPFNWGLLRVKFLFEQLEQHARLGAGCSCHEEELKAGLHVDCPMKGCQLPRLICGGRAQHISELESLDLEVIDNELHNDLKVPAQDACLIVTIIDRARWAAVAVYSEKTLAIVQYPLVIGGLLAAEEPWCVDLSVVKDLGKQIYKDLTGPGLGVPGLESPQVEKFRQIEFLEALAKFNDDPDVMIRHFMNMSLAVAPLSLINVMEQQAEGDHA